MASQIEFRQFLPECMDFLPLEAELMIRRAVRRTPCNILGEDEVLERVKLGLGSLYLVKDNHKLIGIVHLFWFIGVKEKILNIELVGGNGIHNWKDELRKFIRQLMTHNNVKLLIINGRKGWGKIFPELKTESTTFSATLTH